MKRLLSLFTAHRPPLTRAINDAAPRCASAINVAFDAKQEWSTLKYGVYPNARGLQVFDKAAAEAMVATFNSRLNQVADAFRGLPSYVGHPDDPEWARANPGVRASAVGRIRELRVGEKGLEFRTALNDEGQRLVAGEAPAFDSYSPNWGMVPIKYQGRDAFRPVELYSIGFTNQPNIPGTYFGLNEAIPSASSTLPPMNKKLLELLAALGLTVAANADEATLATAYNEALAKVQAALADQGKLASAVNEVATLKTQLTSAESKVTTAINEAATLRTSLATERSERAGVILTVAVNEGRITAAQKPEWLAKFTAPGADFAAVSGEIQKLKAINTKSQAEVGSRRGQPVDKTKITAINEAIQAKMTALGTKDRTLAYNTLVREGHELFKAEAAE